MGLQGVTRGGPPTDKIQRVELLSLVRWYCTRGEVKHKNVVLLMI